MIVAFVFFAAMMAGIKAIGTRLPLVEILTVRQLIIVAVLLPLFVRIGPSLFRTKHLGLQIQRGLLGLGAMLTTFTAMIHIPLAETTAIGFSQSLFVTIGAVIFLGETVGWRHWTAIGAGFVGVMVMLKPSGDNLNLYGLLVVLGAIFGAGLTITVRRLAERERTATILAYQAVILLAALGVPTILWWTPPTADEWLLLLMIGSVGAARPVADDEGLPDGRCGGSRAARLLPPDHLDHRRLPRVFGATVVEHRHRQHHRRRSRHLRGATQRPSPGARAHRSGAGGLRLARGSS